MKACSEKRGLSPIIIAVICMAFFLNNAYGNEYWDKRKIDLSDKRGNKIVYESLGDAGESGIHGVIKVYSKKGKLKYFKEPVPPPICDSGVSFPVILQSGSINEQDDIIVFCGDTGAGRHQVLTFIQNGDVIDSLEIGGGDGVIEWLQKFSALLVAGKYSYLNEDGSLGTYMVVYERAVPNFNRNKFIPIFNSHSESKYFEYYEKLKKIHFNKNQGNIPSAMLAALISTMNQNLICSEVQKDPLSRISLKSLINTSIFIQNYGYPSFDFSVCDY